MWQQFPLQCAPYWTSNSSASDVTDDAILIETTTSPTSPSDFVKIEVIDSTPASEHVTSETPNLNAVAIQVLEAEQPGQNIPCYIGQCTFGIFLLGLSIITFLFYRSIFRM